MNTNLVGQYVINGWGDDVQYQVIVAVTVDRDQMTLWARNPDGVIYPYNADGCKTVGRPPLLEEADEIAQRCNACKDPDQHREMMLEWDEMNRRIEKQVTQ